MNARWAMKRAGKWGLEWGMALSGVALAYRRSRYFTAGHRILTYHCVRPKADSSDTVSTAHFLAHMAYLADHYPVVDLDELVKGIAGEKPLETGSVAVTLDDGYKESFTYAAEIMQRYKVPATLFVVTRPLDTGEEVRGRAFLSWDDVRAMDRAGFAIGSHTVNHPSLSAIPIEEARRELATSKRRIEEELRKPPVALSYPYGTLRDISPRVVEIAREVGYTFAVTAMNGLNHRGADVFWLRRTALSAGDGLTGFKLIMGGCLDPWLFVDRWAYRLQKGGYAKGF